MLYVYVVCMCEKLLILMLEILQENTQFSSLTPEPDHATSSLYNFNQIC